MVLISSPLIDCKYNFKFIESFWTDHIDNSLMYGILSIHVWHMNLASILYMCPSVTTSGVQS